MMSSKVDCQFRENIQKHVDHEEYAIQEHQRQNKEPNTNCTTPIIESGAELASAAVA